MRCRNSNAAAIRRARELLELLPVIEHPYGVYLDNHVVTVADTLPEAQRAATYWRRVFHDHCVSVRGRRDTDLVLGEHR